MASNGNEELPPGWSRVGQNRPAYRRDDGYVVKFDNRATWGIQAPGCNQPFTNRPEAKAAMAFVDGQWPLAGHGDAPTPEGEDTPA